ncbi:unnamed protein product [Pieris brassicae]|uniref:Uncharacterized protein n=1 Tax=Pieris brassicae TaxID=7116 RepID=A0A9P0X9S1_PIEBR|nr:unnamed protein product [Pieris brassicae]
MEREKSSVVVSEKREALSKVEVTNERVREDARPSTRAEAEAAAPAVGRWGAEWPIAPGDVTNPLPVSRWAQPRKPLVLTATTHEQLATEAETILRYLLVTDNYDSVNNFISLYDEFTKTQEALFDLFKRYAPPIRSKKHTCVGLGIELIRRLRVLDKKFRGFNAAMGLVSCEEAVVDVHDYVTSGPGPESVAMAEKEHVMVVIQVVVDGRSGVMLADPGYHVPRIVTVMADRAYPHTGWFSQSDEPHCRKEYEYSFNPQNSAYVEWHERVTRGTTVKYQTSLVYVGRPYLDGVNVTERRNLVYNFRSLLARDQKGHLIAGLYFPVGGKGKDAMFTLFFDNGEKRKAKYKFSIFSDPDNIPKTILEEVDLCNKLMNYKPGELLRIISKLAKVISDQSFIDQLLEINEEICRLCL